MPSFIEEETHILEHISLSDNVVSNIKQANYKSLPRVDSLDKLLATLVESDCSLTMEEESTWQIIMQGEAMKQDIHERQEEKGVASNGSSNFSLSRGFPIRYLASLEATEVL